MAITESELKKQLKEGRLKRVYFLYGEETYLSGHYASQIAAKAVGKDDLAEFNLQKFDGRECTAEELEDLAELLEVEYVHIGADTDVGALRRELRWNDGLYRR